MTCGVGTVDERLIFRMSFRSIQAVVKRYVFSAESAFPRFILCIILCNPSGEALIYSPGGRVTNGRTILHRKLR